MNSKGEGHPKLFHSYGMNSDGTLYETIIPCLEFSIEFQSNNLIYHKEYTKRQQIVYALIKHLHDEEGFGYRKISKWLNQSGIKTHRGKKWFNSSVISVFCINLLAEHPQIAIYHHANQLAESQLRHPAQTSSRLLGIHN